MKTLWMLLLAGLLSVAGCEEKEDVVPADSTKISGEWLLIEPASAYAVTLRFADRKPSIDGLESPATFQVSGESSVNQYFSTATVGAGGLGRPQSQFFFSTIGATKRAGPPEAMKFESEYFNKLEKVNRYELTSRNRLRLYYGGENPGMLVYEKK